MTRKDYIRIARALYENRPRNHFINVTDPFTQAREDGLNTGREQAFREILNSIANELKEDNSAFDYERFHTACTGEE